MAADETLSEQSDVRMRVIVAADQIASGLVDLLDSIYGQNVEDAEYRSALAVANDLAVRLSAIREVWDRR